jgi:Holliday junction resolvasome RuvABC endonuclease subunit
VILGIDPGLATFGWARVSRTSGQVLDLGLLEQPAKGKRKDYEARTDRQAQVVVEQLAGVNLVVSEALSFPRAGRSGAVSQSLSWGVLCGVCRARHIQLKRVRPQQWQHAVQGDAAPTVDYEALLARLEEHVMRFGAPAAVAALRRITPSKRTHVLDAVGVGTYGVVRPAHPLLGALQPTRTTRTKTRRSDA